MSRIRSLLADKRVLVGAGILFVLLAIALIVFIVKPNNAIDPPGDPSDPPDEYIPPDGDADIQDYDESPGDASWRNSILSSPLIADVEHLGVRYEVRVSESMKYLYNCETKELVSGSTPGDALGTVLRDWIVPLGSTDLDPADAVFEGCWANISTRLRGLIGYCDEHYELITCARTADYVEYIYKAADDTHYRIAATDDFILYSPLHFEYLFNLDTY